MDNTCNRQEDLLDRAARAMREAPATPDVSEEELGGLLANIAAALDQQSALGDSIDSRHSSNPAARLVPDVPADGVRVVSSQLPAVGQNMASGRNGVARAALPNDEPPFRRHMPRRFMVMLHRKSVRWSVAAAAVLLVTLGGLSILSPSRPQSVKQTVKQPWWLGPPAAWAAEIDTALTNATMNCVTLREQPREVMADGSIATSSTWGRLYVSHDRYRRDIHDGNVLREVQWYVPDQNGTIEYTSVRFDTKSYFAPRPGDGSFGLEDPVERMRFYVRLIDKADRLLPPQAIDGRDCVGFEIRASKYGTNPDTWVDRVWFDTATKLPVRIEQLGRPITGDTTRTFTVIQDQFNYSPDLPADTFVPVIPEGFINAHPDELKKAG